MTILIGILIAISFYMLGLFTNWAIHERELKKLRLSINREYAKNHELEKRITEQENGEKKCSFAHESVLSFLDETEEALKTLRENYNKLREENNLQISSQIHTNMNRFPKKFGKLIEEKGSRRPASNNTMTKKSKRKKLDQDSKIAAIKIAVVSNAPNTLTTVSNVPTSNHHRVIKSIQKANS